MEAVEEEEQIEMVEVAGVAVRDMAEAEDVGVDVEEGDNLKI